MEINKYFKFLLLFATVFISSCANYFYFDQPVKYPTKEIRASLGTISILPVSYPTRIEVFGVARGASEGASMELNSLDCTGIACIILPPIAALLGAILAESTDKVSEHIDTIKKVVDGNVQTWFQQYVYEKSKKVQMVKLSEIIPTVEHTQTKAYPGCSLPIILGRPDYSYLAKRSVNTVLEISVEHLSLGPSKFRSGANPQLFLSGAVHVRILRSLDSEVLFTTKYLFPRNKRELHSGVDYMKLAKWSENDGQKFVKNLKYQLNELAQEIVSDIFVRNRNKLEHGKYNDFPLFRD